MFLPDLPSFLPFNPSPRTNLLFHHYRNLQLYTTHLAPNRAIRSSKLSIFPSYLASFHIRIYSFIYFYTFTIVHVFLSSSSPTTTTPLTFLFWKERFLHTQLPFFLKLRISFKLRIQKVRKCYLRNFHAFVRHESEQRLEDTTNVYEERIDFNK